MQNPVPNTWEYISFSSIHEQFQKQTSNEVTKQISLDHEKARCGKSALCDAICILAEKYPHMHTYTCLCGQKVFLED